MCELPLLMDWKRSSSGGEVLPYSLLPQQMATPSSRRPQVCELPLLMDWKRSSSGGEVLPYSLLPQQTATPLSPRPQAWLRAFRNSPPLLIDVKRPSRGGGEITPQQTMKPSSRSPQLCPGPLLIDVKRS